MVSVLDLGKETGGGPVVLVHLNSKTEWLKKA